MHHLRWVGEMNVETEGGEEGGGGGFFVFCFWLKKREGLLKAFLLVGRSVS